MRLLLTTANNLDLPKKKDDLMNRHRTWLVSAAILIVPAAAAAEDKHPARAQIPDNYGYTFSDDRLLADGFGPTYPRIAVRSYRGRATLIRPRTAFVIELLKTVETL